eukprot:6478355-Amphidinium_carterae.1
MLSAFFTFLQQAQLFAFDHTMRIVVGCRMVFWHVLISVCGTSKCVGLKAWHTPSYNRLAPGLAVKPLWTDHTQ